MSSLLPTVSMWVCIHQRNPSPSRKSDIISMLALLHTLAARRSTRVNTRWPSVRIPILDIPSERLLFRRF